MKTKGIPKSEADRFIDLLVSRSRLLREDIDALEGEMVLKGADGAGALSKVPAHPADLASDHTERELSFGRMESGHEQLKEIGDAFDRIEEGTFGICEQCDEEIPTARLEAIPYARMCLLCQGREEEKASGDAIPSARAHYG